MEPYNGFLNYVDLWLSLVEAPFYRMCDISVSKTLYLILKSHNKQMSPIRWNHSEIFSHILNMYHDYSILGAPVNTIMKEYGNMDGRYIHQSTSIIIISKQT